ncbi:MAG TPA: molybdopterin cofactor-binding domain-containing protein, partial [Acidimicrobiales bacterium]
SPLANGGAFGGKSSSPVAAAAKTLAAEHGRPVRAVLAREDVVRLGPKRPPVAAGLRRDGCGIVRVVSTPGIADAIRAVLPLVEVEEVDVPGPTTSAEIRAAGWAEAAVLQAALVGDADVTIEAPNGATATASIATGGSVRVRVACGDPLDAVVLRSYCIGAAHMALGWVGSEAIAVDAAGVVHDLTIRSFGIRRAVDMPHVDVVVEPSDGAPVNGSDAVFAAVAAAYWIERGLAPDWPLDR